MLYALDCQASGSSGPILRWITWHRRKELKKARNL